MARRRILALPAAVLWAAACAAAPVPSSVEAPAPTGPTPPASAPDSVPVPASASASASAPDSAPAAPAAPPAPRLTSKGYVTWIYGRPKADKRYIGYVRYGRSIALRSTELVRGEGCPGGFYPVEPRGFVCRDRTVTLEPSPRFVETAAAVVASPGPFPFRYAISNGAPMLNRIPTAAEAKRFDARYGPAGKWQPLPKTLSAHEDLAVAEPIAAVDAMPAFLAAGGLVAEARQGLVKEDITIGSMLSFTRAFQAEGRTWLLSADQTVVPADRVRVFRPSEFRGTRLGGDVTLPLAWMRRSDKPKYRRNAAGAIERTEERWKVRAFVPLTGASVEHQGKRYLETREQGPEGAHYVAESDATVAAPVKRYPTGVKPGQKFMVVSITQGTLVAYEDLTPVYATLISPGKGGVPVEGQDPVQMATTPLGTYNVTFKDKATTMSPDVGKEKKTFWIADVPHTQYFKPPFALHAAYWHERFGEPTSAGCINVSPLDAEALFHWSDPKVPDEWQGATGAGAPENGGTTAVVVRR